MPAGSWTLDLDRNPDTRKTEEEKEKRRDEGRKRGKEEEEEEEERIVHFPNHRCPSLGVRVSRMFSKM